MCDASCDLTTCSGPSKQIQVDTCLNNIYDRTMYAINTNWQIIMSIWNGISCDGKPDNSFVDGPANTCVGIGDGRAEIGFVIDNGAQKNV